VARSLDTVRTVGFVLLNLGQLIGEPAFEAARGVLMEVYGYSADSAMRAIADVTERTGLDAAHLVASLAAQHTCTAVIDIMTAHKQLPPLGRIA
jgi:hypothetical protein